MRHQILTFTLFAVTPCSTACATMGAGQSTACQRANTATLADRLADPCGYADSIAECAGLPAARRQEIFGKCQLEQQRARALKLEQPTCPDTTE